MSNASDINPFVLPRGDVSRSKEAIAALTEDLDQHNRWFRDYLASEKRSRERYARRVRREEAKQRRRITQQRVARFFSRAALGFAIAVRSLLNGATYTLAQSRDLTLTSAFGIASTAYTLSSGFLGLLSTVFAWIGVKVHALALASLKAASMSFSWIAVKARGIALAALRATSIGCSWVGGKARALMNASFGTASAGFTWTRVKSRDVSRASLNAAATGSSWIASKMSVIAMSSATAASSGVDWTMTKGHALALASREAASIGYAWTAARTRTLARASSEASSRSVSWIMTKGHTVALATLDAASIGGSWFVAKTSVFAIASAAAASSGVGWTMTKGHAFALASREAASIGYARTAARTRTLARASLSVALTGGSWMRATSGDLVLKLHRAASRGVPWIQAAGQSGADGLMALSAAARATARLQSERASLLALRVTAQTKGDIDALRRAARAGEFASPAWRKVVAIASTQEFVNGFDAEEKLKEPKAACEASGTDDAICQKGEHISSNALICVEPWRCQLPVVQTGRPPRFRHKAAQLEGPL